MGLNNKGYRFVYEYGSDYYFYILNMHLNLYLVKVS